MKYKVTLYQEKYTEVEIEAPSQEDANDLVLSGNYDDDDIQDVTVKESEIIQSEDDDEDDDEETRRDEKHGLYPDKEDISN